MTGERGALALFGLIMLAKGYQYGDGTLYGAGTVAFLILALSIESRRE